MSKREALFDWMTDVGDEAFAGLVMQTVNAIVFEAVAAEREVCASFADAIINERAEAVDPLEGDEYYTNPALREMARRIRARDKR
jgi:hypothetical protein